jgi:hypothetical protein
MKICATFAAGLQRHRRLPGKVAMLKGVSWLRPPLSVPPASASAQSSTFRHHPTTPDALAGAMCSLPLNRPRASLKSFSMVSNGDRGPDARSHRNWLTSSRCSETHKSVRLGRLALRGVLLGPSRGLHCSLSDQGLKS